MKKFAFLIGLIISMITGLNAQVQLEIGSFNLQNSDSGSVINVPILINQGASDVGSMQFKISWDTNVLSPVNQSATNQGLVDPLSATVPGGAWYAGVSNGAISPNWFDNSFTGISLPAGDTLFSLAFVYHGGNTAITFTTNECIIYDIYYNPVSLSLTNGQLTEIQVNNNLELAVLGQNVSASTIGDTLLIPVKITSGYTGVASLQLSIQLDAQVLQLVAQSSTNAGVANPVSSTLLNGGDWVAGFNGNTLVATWFDPTFAGIVLNSNEVLFEIKCLYLGGSTELSFDTLSCFAFDAGYNSIPFSLINGSINGVQPAGFPMISNISATNISDSEALLDAFVYANNALTTVQVQYGTSISYGNTVNVMPSQVTDSVLVSAQLSGLTAETTYHYRFVAENSVGITASQDMSFTTQPEPGVLTLSLPAIDASAYPAGSTLLVPVIVTAGSTSIGSLQLSVLYDTTILEAIVYTATNTGIYQTISSSTQTGGEWMSGNSNGQLSFNWFDPSFTGISLNQGDTLLVLAFTYTGGTSSLSFGSMNYLYDASFNELNINYADGQIFSSTQNLPNLVITELLYADWVSGNHSFVEIYNADNSAINLEGIHFSSGISGNFPSMVLNPGEYLVFAKDSSQFYQSFGKTAYQWTADSLSVNGEYLAISTSGGQVIDSVPYQNGGNWPAINAGTSISLCNPADDNAVGTNWSASSQAVLFAGTNVLLANPGASCNSSGLNYAAIDIQSMQFPDSLIGSIVNIPVILSIAPASLVTALQFEFSYDSNFLQPVAQSSTNLGIYNPNGLTTANGGEWLSGGGTANTLVCNWFDPTFAGISLSQNLQLFELQFIYLGGNTSIETHINNSFVFDESYNNVFTMYTDATISGLSVPSAPVVTTLSASNIQYASATLNGIVLANNSLTNAHFEYGTSTSYGTQLAVAEGQITDSSTVSATISGLQASQTYHFRIVAENSIGTSFGQDLTFTTAPTPAQAIIVIDDFDASYLLPGTEISIPIKLHADNQTISSIQLQFEFDETRLEPVFISATNTGLININGVFANSEWMSGNGVSGVLSCNWFDPTFAGITFTGETTLFNLSFIYLGGSSSIQLDASSNYLYDANFNTLQVHYENGQVTGSQIQDISLKQGWNIMSTYMNPVAPNITSVFSNVISSLSLVKNSDGSVYWPNYTINTIGNMAIGQGYQVRMINADTLFVFGDVVQPEASPINLPVNWSIVGYLRTQAAPIEQMLSDIVSNMVIIKNELGQTYWPQWNLNLIVNMLPGEGYQIKMSANDILTYPANASKYSVQEEAVAYQGLVPTEHNMTICIPLEAWNETPQTSSQILVRNKQNLLIGKATFKPENLQITVWGDDQMTDITDGAMSSEDLFFSIMSDDNEQVLEISNWMEGEGRYAENGLAVVGKISSLVSIEPMVSCYPNPFISSFLIQYQLNDDTNVLLSIYDATGRLVYTESQNSSISKTSEISIDAANWSSGIYTLILSNSKESITYQLVKQ